MNNSIYSFLYPSLSPPNLAPINPSTRFDSIINAYLISHCGLHPPTSPQIGLVVHSECDYFGSVAFPALVDLGLLVNKLGKSSVTWEVGVFERGEEDVRAVGGYTHVFVERERNRPAKSGMPDVVRSELEKLVAVGKAKL